MKNISFFTGLVILFVFGATTYFSSCVHDACVARNVTCENNGTCRDGDCICPSGYDGFYKCIRTGFINDTIPDDNDDTLHIKANNDKFGITFFSVRDSIINVYKGTVNDNFITVPEQTIGNVTLSGSGSLNGKVVTITINSNWPIGNKSKITYAGTRYEK